MIEPPPLDPIKPGMTGLSQARSRWYFWVGGGLLVWMMLWGATYLMVIYSFAAFRVPTGAMEDTIQVGDQVMANKLAYGLRYAATGRPLLGGATPRRGEVVIFRFPKDKKVIYVKRVIGLPGDQIAIRLNKVYINGTLYEEPYLKLVNSDAWDLSDNLEPILVPARAYFVLGDNRRSSVDSRHWGFVPQDDILGRVVRVYWSEDPETSQVRWHRIGQRIQ